jgi:hypothetical protein
MHLGGHARALISRHSLDPKSPEEKRLNDIQEGLIQAHVSVLNYSIKHAKKRPDRVVVGTPAGITRLWQPSGPCFLIPALAVICVIMKPVM